MKILFLAAANSTHTVKWVNALAERDHQVHLVYISGHEPNENNICDKVVLHRLKVSGSKGYYLNAKALRQLCFLIKPDIINAHYASGYGTLVRIARIHPVILSIWGSDVYEFPYQSRVKALILKKNVLYADELTSTSHCMAQQLRRVMGCDEMKICIIPFGVNMELFNPRLYPASVNKIIIGSVKLLKPQYGIDKLIEAVAILLNELQKKKQYEIYEKIEVHIYGDGPQKEKLSNIIRELNLHNKVFLKGSVSNSKVPEVLSTFSVFCAPSYQESFGVAAVEAMAMEKPVVVSDAEGFLETVVDGKCGFITHRGDEKSIADALEQLVLDKRKREILGINGRKRVEELYDWGKNVNIMEKMYYSVIKKGREKNESETVRKN